MNHALPEAAAPPSQVRGSEWRLHPPGELTHLEEEHGPTLGTTAGHAVPLVPPSPRTDPSGKEAAQIGWRLWAASVAPASANEGCQGVTGQLWGPGLDTGRN